jgi:hypothetical protein
MEKILTIFLLAKKHAKNPYKGITQHITRSGISTFSINSGKEKQ